MRKLLRSYDTMKHQYVYIHINTKHTLYTIVVLSRTSSFVRNVEILIEF